MEISRVPHDALRECGYVIVWHIIHICEELVELIRAAAGKSSSNMQMILTKVLFLPITRSNGCFGPNNSPSEGIKCYWTTLGINLVKTQVKLKAQHCFCLPFQCSTGFHFCSQGWLDWRTSTQSNSQTCQRSTFAAWSSTGTTVQWLSCAKMDMFLEGSHTEFFLDSGLEKLLFVQSLAVNRWGR